MSRSTLRFPSSGGRSAALLLTAGAASALLLSGCGTGQISQTAQKVAAVEGVSATAGNLDVSDALITFPASHRYAKGSDAPMSMVISNDGLDDYRLVRAQSSAATAVVLAPAAQGTTPPPLGCTLASSQTGGAEPGETRPPVPAEASASPTTTAAPTTTAPSATASPTTTTAPSATASPTTTTAPSATAAPSGSATPSAAGSASASATPTAAAVRLPVAIPHDGATLLTAGCPHLVAQGLTRDLLPSDAIPLQLTFTKGSTTLTVNLEVPVATANNPLPREEVPGFDTHGGGGAGHGESASTGHGESPTAGSHG